MPGPVAAAAVNIYLVLVGQALARLIHFILFHPMTTLLGRCSDHVH